LGERIVGFVSYRPNGVSSSSLVSLLCIEPSLRRRGAGARLMKAVEEHVFSYDKNLFLFVSAFNTSAVDFYQALRYERVGAITDYNLPGQTELMFRKTIGPRRAST